MITDFIFDGKSAKNDFDLYIVSINDNSKNDVVSNRNISNFQPANSDSLIWTATENGEALSTTIEVICMGNCVYKDLFDDDIETIARWFSREDGFHKLSFVSNTDENDYYYNAHINVSKAISNSSVIGLSFEITTDSQYAFKEVNHSFEVKENEEIILSDYSSKLGRKPLNVKIKPKSNTDMVLSHTFGNKTLITKINNCSSNEEISITEFQTITSSNKNHDISDDFNYIYPSIYNDINDSKNIYSLNCDGTLNINYKQRRKVGIL